jgi:hypothetical protein
LARRVRGDGPGSLSTSWEFGADRYHSATMANDNANQLGEMSDDERERIRKVLSTIPDPKVNPSGVTWLHTQYLDVWLTEHRVRAERRATARLTTATWVLMGATAVLAFATIALVIATAAHG